MMTPKELAILAAKALDEKKGKEISAIEITDITTLADYFVITSGSSDRQVAARVVEVEPAAGRQPRAQFLQAQGLLVGTIGRFVRLGVRRRVMGDAVALEP